MFAAAESASQRRSAKAGRARRSALRSTGFTNITFRGITDRYWGHLGPKGGIVTVVPDDFVPDPANDPERDEWHPRAAPER
jgi:hypothetical protein